MGELPHTVPASEVSLLRAEVLLVQLGSGAFGTVYRGEWWVVCHVNGQVLTSPYYIGSGHGAVAWCFPSPITLGCRSTGGTACGQVNRHQEK